MAKYNTCQRQLILDYLKENMRRHVTVDDVLYYLRESGNPVGRTTVYRYFDALISEGLLIKFDGATGKSACYQLVDGGGCQQHYHFICDKCTKLFHVDCSVLDDAKKHIRSSHAFQISCLKTIFHGTCEKCLSL